ncbi:hypothetical protein CBM2634_A220019 [Cupriavidus taiwanensis]|uniref:Uncharacterized protein n=1 Tax=Cupriavidus taiwanensis TaxID=164546 RepID=A0A375IZL0_9BURK|nr:hypothetical protein CBM2634_A220019 [Cupriavidus taiwanensis]
MSMAAVSPMAMPTHRLRVVSKRLTRHVTDATVPRGYMCAFETKETMRKQRRGRGAALC